MFQRRIKATEVWKQFALYNRNILEKIPIQEWLKYTEITI